MKRRDWLLLAIGDGLDPIRIQKAMFLFAMESDAPDTEKYAFEPYNWGPFSQPIYGDLTALQINGLIERVAVANADYFRYRQTPKGVTAADALVKRADREAVAKLASIRKIVTTLGFTALLKQVYKKYPAFATKSLFQGA
jgi:uncharacterized protein YwgA